MPIKGLSEERRLPRAGKIHLGVKQISQRGNPYPTATDYFVVRANETTSEAAANAFRAAYGETPKSLDILFPNLGDDLNAVKEIVFPQYYKQYGSGSGLKCKGDGQTAERVDVDAKTGVCEKKRIPCKSPEECPFVKKMADGHGGLKCDCGPVAHLQVLLPRVDYLGIWQIDTGSEITIKQINSDLDLVYMAAGSISNIPLKLDLVPRQVAPGGKKKTVYTLTIAYAGSLKQLRLLRSNKQAFLVDLVDDEEIPSDIRPPEALQPHPLSGLLGAGDPAESAADRTKLTAPTASPAVPLPLPKVAPIQAPTAAVKNPPAAANDTTQAPAGATPFFDAAFGENQPPVDAELVDEPEIAEAEAGTAQEPAEAFVDPIESSIQFHTWRLGLNAATRDSLRKLHAAPEKFLTALQKTPTSATRATLLAKAGYGPDGFTLKDKKPGPPAGWKL